ncbi:MAG: right-handed parallel beta-helix repeat-containing protein, partial [Candidatus Omnitrophica bacterium]|nr:right-handed parallel beta-helix repeat-containing protein [Candidatus Omnitrophota bacterium]
MRTFPFFLFLWFISASIAHSATLTVGKGGGFDHPSIASAVGASLAGDTILVAPGVYDTTGGETFPILLDKNLSLIGSSSDEVIVNATGSNRSVIGVNQVDNFEIAGLTITGGSSEFGGGGIYVFDGNGTIHDCNLEGNSTTRRGGGLYLEQTQIVTVERCLFRGNLAHDEDASKSSPKGFNTEGNGGGMSVVTSRSGSTTILDCQFIRNSASYNASGLSLFGQGETHVEDCFFTLNSRALKSIVGTGFGAAYVDHDATATFQRCIFRENLIEDSPDAAIPFIRYNYALINDYEIGQGSLTVQNCEFSNNKGMGGLHAGGGGVIDSVISNNEGRGLEAWDSQIDNCLIQNNGLTGVFLHSAEIPSSLRGCQIISNGKFGSSPHVGGIEVQGGEFTIDRTTVLDNTGLTGSGGVRVFADQLTMTNCVVGGNDASGNLVIGGSTGGLSLPGGSREGNLTIVNCTIADNTAEHTEGAGSQDTAGILVADNADVAIVNSIVWNGTRAMEFDNDSIVSIAHSALSQNFQGDGNIFEDPLFFQPWDGESADLRLPCDSPCVDAGTIDGAPSRDIEGVTRPRGSGVDMGAYENCRYDVNGDRSEDVKDLLSFPPEWYRPVDETNFGYNLIQLGPSEDRIDAADLD